MIRNKKNYLDRNHTGQGGGSYVRGNTPRTTLDVHRVFREFANGTSMHGVPRIINARSIAARIFWSIICIVAFGMFFWQTGVLLNRYYSYPKKVNVEIIQRPVQFPWVSVCNTGHMDLLTTERLEIMLTGIGNITDENPVLDTFQEEYEAFWGDSSFFFQPYLENFAQFGFEFDQAKENMYEVYSRLGLTANIGVEMASAAGIKLEDLVVHCKYMAKTCNITSSFFKLFDPYYFNCFTFDPTKLVTSNANRLQGVEYGLSLLLFTGTAGELAVSTSYNYLVPGMEEADIALASGRSARVVVHAPNTRPHLTAEGYDIPPGFSVTIGVKANENVRISHPHGNCTKDDALNSTYKYTLARCQINCLQNAIMHSCGCVDNKISLPDDSKGLPYCLQLPTMPVSCFVEFSDKCMDYLTVWSESMKCRRGVYVNMTINDPESIDVCQCHPPCNDIVYDTSYSLSTIPPRNEEHSAFYSVIDQFIENMSPKRKAILERKYKEDHDNAQDYEHDLSVSYISRLNVHIADSNVVRTVEAPDYEAIRLVSDIGGQLGLWIGT